MRPLIGLTAGTGIADNGLPIDRVYNAVAQAVADAGGLPVYIPTVLDEASLREIYERLDAVLLPGGPDIDPSYYSESPHPTVKTDPARDAIEVPLVRWAVNDDMPVFGICRGHQVVNVALGGTLVQDMPSQLEAVDPGHEKAVYDPRDEPVHDVCIDPATRLGQIMGTTQAGVNSIHHQAVRRPAPGMVVSATAPDGVIEGTEMPDKFFVVTVQWHPEDLYTGDAPNRRLFEAFVNAARERAAR